MQQSRDSFYNPNQEPQLSKMTFDGTFPNVSITVFVESYELLYNNTEVLSRALCMVNYGNVLYFIRSADDMPSNDTYTLDLDNVSYSSSGSGNNYALSKNFPQLNTPRSYSMTCALNKYDNYLYVSDSNTNPIERIDLSNSSIMSWESLDMIDLSTLMCGNSTYEWFPTTITPQAGMFINENTFYLIGGITLRNQIIRIIMDTQGENFAYSCVNYAFDEYEFQSVVK